jgi:hypothetical protein
MIEGRCICGQVAFEIDPSEISLFNNCYCKKCQQYSGTGFVSQLQVRKSGFSWLHGEALITHFESSPGVFRAFCSRCGSRLPMSKQESFVPVPAGLLVQDPGCSAEVNMHLSSKANWALVDNSIHCLNDQGSSEFWSSFMESKQSDA